MYLLFTTRFAHFNDRIIVEVSHQIDHFSTTPAKQAMLIFARGWAVLTALQCTDDSILIFSCPKNQNSKFIYIVTEWTSAAASRINHYALAACYSLHEILIIVFYCTPRSTITAPSVKQWNHYRNLWPNHKLLLTTSSYADRNTFIVYNSIDQITFTVSWSVNLTILWSRIFHGSYRIGVAIFWVSCHIGTSIDVHTLDA